MPKNDKPLTPEERRELVTRPFPIETVGCQKSWKGSPMYGDAMNQWEKIGTRRDPDVAFIITRVAARRGRGVVEED